MDTTPVWVPLIVAVLGLIGTAFGTIAGVLITQRRSDRRDAASWQREREREHERWAREDASRTFDHRRAAYTQFYESLQDMALRAYNHGMGLSDDGEELPEGWQSATFHRLQHLEVYATTPVQDAAAEAYSAVWWWGNRARHGRDDDGFYDCQDRSEQALYALRRAIRHDLAIPET